ncbi:MAG: aldo/keto reductase [Balneolaceae bacterium]|nr:MAG: aldo/keto reductase [Balneolaceae bacterium]
MTNDLLQKIGIGTVQFGTDYGISNTYGQTPSGEVVKILHFCRQYGVTLLDTAPAYGDAEKVIGANDLTGFRVVSKFMPPRYLSIEDQLKKSLTNLNHDSLYGYLAHRPEDLLINPVQWNILQQLKDLGSIKKVGFSLNKPAELHALIEENMIPDLVQVPFNYFDKRFENDFKILKRYNCEIHARSVFLQGLFFKKSEELSLFFDQVKPVIQSLQRDFSNLAQSLLMHVLKHPMIDRVIIGVNNSAQFLNNLNGIGTAEELPTTHLEIPEEILMPSNWPAK